MEIRSFCNANPNAVREIKPAELIRENLLRLDYFFVYLKKKNPELLYKYATTLKQVLNENYNKFQFDYSFLDLDDITSDFQILNNYSELQDAVILFSFYYLNPPRDYTPGQEEVKILLLDWLKAQMILRYNRIKALTLILGRNEGIQLWKGMVYDATLEAMKNTDEEIHRPINEIADSWIEEGQSDNTPYNLTVVKYDDNKCLVKFDTCGSYEALRTMDDSEIAYLSWCYGGEVESKIERELNKRSRRKFTPVTLHQHSFCVEFYWDNDVHPNAEPPSLDELTRMIEESKSEK